MKFLDYLSGTSVGTWMGMKDSHRASLPAQGHVLGGYQDSKIWETSLGTTHLS